MSATGVEEWTTPAARPIVIGKITAVYGIKGWLKVHSYTEPKENLLGYHQCLLGQGGRWQPLTFQEGRIHGNGLVVQLYGVGDRDQAAPYVGMEIAIAIDQLPALDAEEYYWHQLESLRVWANTTAVSDGSERAVPSGVLLGSVHHLLETGANDVLVVRRCEGSVDERERLIPWLPGQVVTEVNLAAGYLRVDWDPEF